MANKLIPAVLTLDQHQQLRQMIVQDGTMVPGAQVKRVALLLEALEHNIAAQSEFGDDSDDSDGDRLPD